MPHFTVRYFFCNEIILLVDAWHIQQEFIHIKFKCVDFSAILL